MAVWHTFQMTTSLFKRGNDLNPTVTIPVFVSPANLLRPTSLQYHFTVSNSTLPCILIHRLPFGVAVGHAPLQKPVACVRSR